MKVFLPDVLFNFKKNCDLYGYISQHHGKKTTAFYVIEAVELKAGVGDYAGNQLTCIGQILHRKIKKQVGQLCFRYDDTTPNIYLDTKDCINCPNVNIYLYEPAKLMQINQDTPKPFDDISTLKCLLEDHQNRKSKNLYTKKNIFGLIFYAAANLPLQLMTRVFVFLLESKIVVTLIRRTSFYEHYKDWRKYQLTGKRSWNIALDKILGIIVMLVLLFYLQDPGDYVIATLHLVIDKLRLLLRSLKGSPIGLKLNVHLNNFFLDCFNYHIDLWATFLNIIEPLVQQLFLPLTILGSMGFSCQLALLADLLSIVGLHAHCFHIYASVLYKVEIQGLSVLWKVVRGKRYNVLKERVELHNYMNRQLYLSTIFFTTLLFLFPTILVYYVVFTTLRLCTYTVNWLLKTLRRRILELPLEDLYKWCQGNYKDRDSIQIQHVCDTLLQQTKETHETSTSVFKLTIHSSSLGRVFSNESGVLKEDINEDVKLNLFKLILTGNFYK